MLSDIYFDAKALLENGRKYFKVRDIFNYGQREWKRLEAYISLLRIEVRLKDCLGNGLAGDPEQIEKYIADSKINPRDIDHYNRLLESLKIHYHKDPVKNEPLK